MDDYDEFGNYIGPLSDSGSEEEFVSEPGQDVGGASAAAAEAAVPAEASDAYGDHEMDASASANDTALVMHVDEDASNAVVLHEDKIYYPSAREVYGADVETLVQEEDAQPLTQPIVEPERIRSFAVEEKGLPEVRFDRQFLLDMMQFPDMVRNVAIVGHLHHGKTSLVDMLVEETHRVEVDAEKPMRYTDTHVLEQERGLSIRATPMSFVLPTSRGKSYVVHVADTPGHTNFQDEVAAALRLADGVVLVVDAVEGMMCNTEAIVRYCVHEQLPMVMVLNKIDRLILELRLPPAEAYFKLRHTIEEVNHLIGTLTGDPSLRFGPERGNVAFASTQVGYCFTLRSFAKLYAERAPVDVEAFAQRLWGQIFYDASSRTFSRKAPHADAPRSFVQFVLEPLYKLYSVVLSADVDTLRRTLATLRMQLPSAAYKMDVRPLLKLVLQQFVGRSTGLVDMLVEHIPSALDGAAAKVRTLTGPSESRLAQAVKACDAQGPLLVQIAKLFPTSDASAFRAWGRVLSGTVQQGQRIKVLGPSYTADDEEDMALETVDGVWVSEARYVVGTDRVPAGSWVLLGGIDASITKSATLVDATWAAEETALLQPLHHMTESVLKVAIEPLHPAELPKMLEGLRSVNKTYPLVSTRVEESGEHTLIGTGELYLDCVMHDLRQLYADMEIKISDPVVKFCETVLETSAVQCYADTPNKQNRLTVIAEPLEKELADDIEQGRVDIDLPPKQLARVLQDRYGWDALAARSVWAFGPDAHGPNVLVDDTLPDDVDKTLVYAVREHIKQGFQWAAREGPLCDEPMRGVKIRLCHANVATEPIQRGGGQLIPTARRVTYAAFLLATPRLMEPIYAAEIQAPAECVSSVYTLLARRRGHVVQDAPKAGTPLVTVKALIPVMDANGFETDLRVMTQGQAFVLQQFDHWAVVPGDPMDTSVPLRPLEPAPPLGLARDFVLKMRRRKGLGDVISVSSYLESDMAVALAQAGIDVAV
ncbi:p-loop containing nucleoside triphosphate hydrolase protein [Malassezia pachydermatis]|uniref:p-loop containing nucleoside triphosphate hydrolase protein n=1 Tax=Malassezia pachydermatis TaxID=77020 RepID=A0A0M8MNG0_9BASI|nr:p-loop containing nucleoside triphosphate hydrolase protein [Malassezia pachydermatis]KOS13637.1 p-loop containing nucleoside triphosphate hydrolase protein [Malassezia pachydermatis]